MAFNAGEIRGEVSFSNISVLGFSKFSFTDVRAHFLDDVFRLEIDAHLPWSDVESAVKLDGTITIFKISGEGRLINSMQLTRA